MNKSDLLIILSKQNIKFDVLKILNSLFNTNVPKNAFKNMVKIDIGNLPYDVAKVEVEGSNPTAPDTV